MKDKPKSKTTFNDLIHEEAKKNPEKKMFNKDGLLDPSSLRINEKELIAHEKDMRDYNNSMEELDELYSNLKPMSKILVRVFVVEPERKNGLIIKYTHKVNIPTSSGVGHLGAIESPYPYSRLAIVVAVPEGYQGLKPGDKVQLSDDPVRPIPMGGGNDAAITIPMGFTHYSWKDQQLPTNVTSQHYGYLLISPHSMIDCKI